jgi:hypothetical protein
MDNNKKAPIFSESYTISGTKIVVIFSGIFIFMKFFAVLTQELWVLPNLIIALPALLLGIGGIMLLQKRKTNWWFILFAFVVFVAIRLNEEAWVVWLQQNI